MRAITAMVMNGYFQSAWRRAARVSACRRPPTPVSSKALHIVIVHTHGHGSAALCACAPKFKAVLAFHLTERRDMKHFAGLQFTAVHGMVQHIDVALAKVLLTSATMALRLPSLRWQYQKLTGLKL